MSVCLVSARDFDRHFTGMTPVIQTPTPWNGHERRTGPADPRANRHDRRCNAEAGRRLRLSDRRRRPS